MPCRQEEYYTVKMNLFHCYINLPRLYNDTLFFYCLLNLQATCFYDKNKLLVKEPNIKEPLLFDLHFIKMSN